MAVASALAEGLRVTSEGLLRPYAAVGESSATRLARCNSALRMLTADCSCTTAVGVELPSASERAWYSDCNC